MTKPILTDIEAMEQIIQARHWDPFSILGPHKLGQNPLNCETVIRALLPTANRVWIVSDNLERSEMGRIGVDGFFEIGLKVGPSFPYRFQVEGTDGHTWEQIDPYQFQPVLGELDFHLVREGTHERLYDKLGAHLVNHQGVAGVTFAVWAPNAERVSVIGDFNRWDGRQNLMRVREQSGVWELFIPGMQAGDHYKFEIRTRDGRILTKADPIAFQAEVRPQTASIVADLSEIEWSDNDWMEHRAQRQEARAPWRDRRGLY